MILVQYQPRMRMEGDDDTFTCLLTGQLTYVGQNFAMAVVNTVV